MNSKGKILAFTILGLFFVGCSNSSEPDTINTLYRESDSYRARLFALGCQVGHQQSMGGKTDVTCTEVDDGDVLLERARVLKEWTKVLAKIEKHPELPSVALPSYKRLQAVVTAYADELETFVITERRVEKEQRDQVTNEYRSLSQSFSELEQKLMDFGCDFLADPRAENFDEICDLYHASEKIQILEELVNLTSRGQALQGLVAGMEFEQEVKDLNVKLINLTSALKNHLSDNANKALSNVYRIIGKLTSSDFRVRFSLVAKEKPLEVTFSAEKRNEEGVAELIAILTEYIEAVDLLVQYADLLDNSRPVGIHQRRRESAIAFLKEPLTLEYILENYEPEDAQNLDDIDLTPAPEPRHGGIFASNFESHLAL